MTMLRALFRFWQDWVPTAIVTIVLVVGGWELVKWMVGMGLMAAGCR